MSRLLNFALALSAGTVAAVGFQAIPAHAATPVTPALLVGKLGIDGGAYPGKFHPTAGSVEVAFDSVPLTLEKKVGPSGKFRIPLGAGSYTVIGCGPSASGGTPSSQCSTPHHIKLTAGEVDHIRLVWAHVP